MKPLQAEIIQDLKSEMVVTRLAMAAMPEAIIMHPNEPFYTAHLFKVHLVNLIWNLSISAITEKGEFRGYIFWR